MRIRPETMNESDEGVVRISAQIKRNGELLSAPTILTRLSERAIVSTTNGPEAPFFFLVIEIDRLSSGELAKRGLRHSWRKDYFMVDGEDVTAPIPVTKSQPAYPEEAREHKYQGRVVLRVVIDAEGAIEDVEVVKGQPYGLSEAAVEAAKTWRFIPAERDGEPVAVFYFVTINFQLE